MTGQLRSVNVNQHYPGAADRIQVRIRQKNNYVETRTGSVTRTMGELDEQRRHRKELREANQRLKVLGQLEAYREEKIAKEMMLLGEQRRLEEEKINK